MNQTITQTRCLGVSANPLSEVELNNIVQEAILLNKKVVIGNHNLHSIYLFHRDIKMKQFYDEAHITYVDGMPIIYWARLLGYKVGRKQRVTGLDWILSMFKLAACHSWRIFHLGGRPGVAQIAAERLQARFSGLSITVHHGFFSSDENGIVIDMINSFQPDILIVGMGMPKQEHWILDNYRDIQANVIIAFGACFDYIAGAIPYPPRWTGRVGLERV